MSYIGQGLPADVFSGFTTDAFTGDGSATTFTLSKAPFSEDGLIVVINNVIQRPTTNFTVSGTTLTIVGTAVADGDVIYAIHTSGAVPSTLASKVDVNGVSDAVILDADGDSTISADSDDQIDFKVGGSDVLTLGPSNLSVDISGNIRLDAGDNGEIRLLDDGTQYGALKVDSSRLKIQGTVSDADMLFAVNDGGSEVTALTLDSSEAGLAIFHTGVAIGGTGAANTLDDYEEGTWTPAISNVTTSAVTGKYTKIGRHVSLHLYMAISGGTLDSTTIQITGVPFANGNHEAIGSIMYNQLDHSADYQVMPYFNQGTTSIRFYQSKDATGWSSLATNAFSSSTSFFISLVYES